MLTALDLHLNATTTAGVAVLSPCLALLPVLQVFPLLRLAIRFSACSAFLRCVIHKYSQAFAIHPYEEALEVLA
jgi:hypothetical protein